MNQGEPDPEHEARETQDLGQVANQRGAAQPAGGGAAARGPQREPGAHRAAPNTRPSDCPRGRLYLKCHLFGFGRFVSFCQFAHTNSKGYRRT